MTISSSLLLLILLISIILWIRAPESITLCEDRVALNSWYGPSRGDYYTTTHHEWTVTSTITLTTDYRHVKEEGWVCSPDSPQPPGTVPLYSWWSSLQNDNLTTTDPGWAGKDGDTRGEGYGFAGLQGYIYSPAAPQPEGTIPLRSWHDDLVTDHFATAYPQLFDTRGDITTVYGTGRLEGYIIK